MSILSLGLIQALSEFLPVSSSGHLNLFQQQPSLSLDIFLHLATLLSVLVYFRTQISFFVKNLKFIIVATLPAALIGVFLNDRLESIFSQPGLLPFFFLITSVLVFSTKLVKPKNEELNYQKALIIGLFQALAIMPGISRSGSTIFAGLLMGLSPITAFKFSFTLFIPATLGAMVLNLPQISQISFDSTYLLAFILAFAVGLLALSLVKKFISNRTFWIFSIYTFLLSLVLYVLI